MRVSRIALGAGALAGAVLAGAPATAHHSFAMFDRDKSVTLTGSVREFQWTNPHAWVQMLVKDASGKDVEWSIEGASTINLTRQGWSRNSLKPGDRVVIVIHPLKDGSPGGSLVSATINGVELR